LRSNGEADVKDLVTCGTDKEPFGAAVLFLEHGVKPVFVSTSGADLEILFEINLLNLVSQNILLVARSPNFVASILLAQKN
jgi:hypothetical protein